MKSQNSIHKQETVQPHLNRSWSRIASTSNRNDWKLSFVLVLPFLLVLNSCCRGIVCDCFDEGDTTIGFNFNMDSTQSNGFKKAELADALLIRFSKSGQALDSSRLRFYDSYYESGFSINNYRATEVKSFQDTCTYRIVNEVGNVDLTISDIQLQGRFNDGCCSCYTNESISFRVNGELINQGGNGRAGASYLINKK